ncbi:MAG TPA: protein-L-isoaspartate(D-aspartate) O-methyltransferase [Pirellulaceae bacterium]|nr:protein-L-isoaspartate(D-aspartate) O-methyltransferase [Pirellulaceae bacterium]
MRGSFRWAATFAVVIVTAASAQQPMSRAQFEEARNKLVDEILVPAGITNPLVAKAMRNTLRHEFVTGDLKAKAYFDMALAIGGNQTISSPLIVSQMTQALDPQLTDKVLEIGTGSGYQAAVLSPLVKDVYTIEIVPSLGTSADARLKRLGYKNVHVKVGDGYLGWPEHAPFNKIIVTCSPEKVPQPLTDQLADGGLMVVPVGERYSQTLYMLRKKDGKLESEALLPTLFVPMTGKAEDIREVKPDTANPKLVNGSFEMEAGKFKNGAQTGWYYERQVQWASDRAPDGGHYVEFKNTEPGLPSHLLQGFGIDGRKVQQLTISGLVKTDNVVPGAAADTAPHLVVTLYSEERKELGNLMIGPFKGTSGWREQTKTFRIPPDARHGIFRIGLFGATGTVAFDKLEIKKAQ